jgi:hypothetical protein
MDEDERHEADEALISLILAAMRIKLQICDCIISVEVSKSSCGFIESTFKWKYEHVYSMQLQSLEASLA